MANYESPLMTHRVPLRGIWEGDPQTHTGVILIKAGTKLTDGDTLKFMRIGPFVSVIRLQISTDGDLDDAGTGLQVSAGYFQALDSAGDPLETLDTRPDTFGETLTSPASNSAAFVANAANTLRTLVQGTGGVLVYDADELATFDADGYAGVVDLGLEVHGTATGAAAADTRIRFTVDLLEKEGPLGEFYGSIADAGDSYRYDANGSNGGLVS
jgi:hypothetical protein